MEKEMSDKSTIERAFPMIYIEEGYDYASGMTLRDHFAAYAMSALISGGAFNAHHEADSIALKSYVIAEAMMDRRKRIHDDESAIKG